MARNINKKLKLVALSVLLFSGQAFAQQSESLLNFKFNHQTNINSSEAITVIDTDTQAYDQLGEINANTVKFTQYRNIA